MDSIAKEINTNKISEMTSRPLCEIDFKNAILFNLDLKAFTLGPISLLLATYCISVRHSS